MDKMLYVSMTGASQNAAAMRAHANNLANVSTSGFRRDLEQSRSMQVFGDSFPSRVYAMSERPGTDFTPGPLVETGRDLDVAVQGNGWIAVQAPDGSEAYERTASMQVDALGILRTGNGTPVLGDGGPVAVPPASKIEIGEDGTLSIRAEGQAASVIAVVDRLRLVNPDQTQMEKGLDGMIHMKAGQPAPEADASVRVVSGFVEGSNVSAVEEMTSILALSRQFELHIKMMRTAEEDASAMGDILKFN
ncbi:flagellar basal body rod protein FlgF [Pseudomonas sp. LRF_L74]|uniref:flagellar basal body rod protein FlgF n=1 Tax=Pseudomonas sp. LRF_L74 TaxID=3369422 RepID=UPI003F6255D5